MGCIKLNNTILKQLLSTVDTILTDCDGVLWHDNNAIHGVNETLLKLRKLGKKVFYVTNNSTKTRAQFATKCQQLGFQACEDEIVGSSYVAAQYIRNYYSNVSRAFVIGSLGLREELQLAGISSFGELGPPASYTLESMRKDILTLKDKVDCVVVGYDEYFNYNRLATALAYLKDKNCPFIATNTDSTYPSPGGFVLPGTGSIVKCVETAACRPPDAICGKPFRPMADVVIKANGIDPSRTLMIGDRLDTDIAFGFECKFKSLAVLTGVCSLEELHTKASSNLPEDIRLVPDFLCAIFR